MRSSVLFSIFFIFALCITLTTQVQGDDGQDISAVVAEEETDGEVQLTVRIVSTMDDGYVSVLIRNNESENILLETVRIIDGHGEVKVTMDRGSQSGDYQLFLSGITSDDGPLEPAREDFSIAAIIPPPRSPDIPWYEEWISGVILSAVIIVVLIIIAVGMKRRKRAVHRGMVTTEKPVPARNKTSPRDFRRKVIEDEELIEDEEVPKNMESPITSSEKHSGFAPTQEWKRVHDSAKREDTVTVCPSCKKLMEEKYLYCTNCGAKRL